MENYKVPYASKTGVAENVYQQVLGEAFRNMTHDGPVLLRPRVRVRGSAWRQYRRGVA